MKVKLHWKDKDSIILEAETIEELRKQVKKEMELRGWKSDDCWSVEIK